MSACQDERSTSGQPLQTAFAAQLIMAPEDVSLGFYLAFAHREMKWEVSSRTADSVCFRLPDQLPGRGGTLSCSIDDIFTKK